MIFTKASIYHRGSRSTRDLYQNGTMKLKLECKIESIFFWIFKIRKIKFFYLYSDSFIGVFGRCQELALTSLHFFGKNFETTNERLPIFSNNSIRQAFNIPSLPLHLKQNSSRPTPGRTFSKHRALNTSFLLPNITMAFPCGLRATHSI